jgi:hypothetical protein
MRAGSSLVPERYGPAIRIMAALEQREFTEFLVRWQILK